MTESSSLFNDDLCWDALDHLTSLVRVWTPEEGVLYVNQPWMDLTGTTRADNRQDGWMQVIHDEDRAAVRDVVARAAATREPFSVDYRVRCRDGQYLALRDWAQPWMEGDTATVLGVVHTCVPAAESGAAANPDPDKTSLFQWAHELRGPLNAILGWSDLLAAEAAEPELLRRGLEAIANNARQQAAIIRRMAN